MNYCNLTWLCSKSPLPVWGEANAVLEKEQVLGPAGIVEAAHTEGQLHSIRESLTQSKAWCI